MSDCLQLRMLSTPLEREEDADLVRLEVIREAIRGAIDDIVPAETPREEAELLMTAAAQAAAATVVGAGEAAEDAVAQWRTAEERERISVGRALRHWAGSLLRVAFHGWLSRTDPRTVPLAAAEAAGGRGSVAMLDGPGHHVRTEQLPEQAVLGGQRLYGPAAARIRSVSDSPLPLGGQHEVACAPLAFETNHGAGSLAGPPWGAPAWATQPEHSAALGYHLACWPWPAPLYAPPLYTAPPPPAPQPEPEPGSDDGAGSDTAEKEDDEGHGQEEEEEGPVALGGGWEERRTAEGRPYYANHFTQRTQWQRPLGLPHPADPLGPLRTIRLEKAALRMRAAAALWDSEAARDQLLGKAVHNELAAASAPIGNYMRVAEERLAGVPVGGGGTVMASELEAIRTRAGVPQPAPNSFSEPVSTAVDEARLAAFPIRSRLRPGSVVQGRRGNAEQENIVPRRQHDGKPGLRAAAPDWSPQPHTHSGIDARRGGFGTQH